MEINIREFLQKLNLSTDDLEAVGNHELKRHLVYSFKDSNTQKIIKVYYRNNRLCNELVAYNIAKESSIPTAEILLSGRLGDYDYLVMTKLPGSIMTKTIINQLDLISYYKKLGRYLGSLHKNRVDSPKDYKDKWIQEVSQCSKDLKSLPCDNTIKDIFNFAYAEFIKNVDLISFDNIPFGFCHGDFDSRNILVFGGEISGVIDFERAGFGNTEMDIVQLYRKTLMEDQALRKAFFEGYESIIPLQEDFKSRLHLYLIADCIDNCSWSFDQARDYFYENVEFLKRYLRV